MFAAALIFLIVSGTRTLGYHWQWYRVPRYLFSITDDGFTSGPLMDGLLVTFQITGVSLLLAFSLGLVAVLFRLSNSFSARALARSYLELIRNTPLLIQLFFLYFVIVPFGEWEKNPRLQAKTLVGLRYGALPEVEPHSIRYQVSF
ncbi:MAG TPA: hypothetical protein ENN34_08910, partial [Deltaproteobacteria bacterium]|nr:hypothetical protein [Deltaproteobacteria bacterium]